jgi:alpha-L-rhamnosidase
MKSRYLTSLLIILALSYLFFPVLKAEIVPVNLKFEYLTNPLGIDEVNPRLSWQSISSENGQFQTYYEILVASSKGLLEKNEGNFWSSGKIKSGESINILYQGKELESFDECWWKVRIWDKNGDASDWSEPAFWSMGIFTDYEWKAEWINRGEQRIGGQTKQEEEDILNCVKLRKDFYLSEKAKNAKAFVNVLGFYELYINGEKVSNNILSPAVSDYSSHSLYKTYEISSFLKEGKNVIGIWLAPGWYRKDSRDYYGISEEVPLVRARFNITLENGKEMLLRTDRTWRVKLSERKMLGKWLWGNFGGETVNGNKIEQDWSHPDYDASDWEQAYNYKPSRVPAISERSTPTIIKRQILPKQIEQLGEDEYLVDFGEVFTGWIDVTLRDCEVNKKINFRYADKDIKPGDDTSPLEMNFTVNFKNDPENRRFVIYNQQDNYIASGKGEENFINKFNYHAFRWVLIKGIKDLHDEDIVAYMIGNDIEKIAEVETSNDLLNGIWNLINNTFENLTHTGYVVDCPHRERIGYGGDMHASLETSLCNYDLSSFFNKWMIDWRVNNYPTGFWTNSAPEPPQHNYNFNPGWGSFGVALPWRYYNYYGDTINLARAYPFVRDYINYMKMNVKDGILYNDSLRAIYNRSFIGDWVPPGYDMTREGRIDDHSTHLFNNCIYLYAVDMARSMAKILNKPEDEKYFDQLINESKDKIHEYFFNPETNDYVNGQQPYLAFPLLTGIVPKDKEKIVSENLEHLIKVVNNGHLQSGMLGTHFLFEYLMKADRNDLIYLMVNQKTYPGWGYMLEQGATTVWEQWNGHNSQVHNCYLAGGAWFIRGLGGIKPDKEIPGMKHFYIVPAIIEDLDFANVSYQSLYGVIKSNWKRTGNKISFEIEVPCNTTASFILPDQDIAKLTLNDSKIRDLKNSDEYPGRVIELGSGNYNLTWMTKN